MSNRCSPHSRWVLAFVVPNGVPSVISWHRYRWQAWLGTLLEGKSRRAMTIEDYQRARMGRS